MAERGYQLGYSTSGASVHDWESRRRKAATIHAVLSDWWSTHGSGRPLSSCQVLDVGASTGVIDFCLAEHFAHVTGIDIDEGAIAHARARYMRENLEFEAGDAMHLNYADGSFDIVICTHVYEHVPDADRLMREISRVLRPGGVSYFTAGNRFALIEPHYQLPFLSVIPKRLAHVYLRLLGRGHHYYEEHRALPGLLTLVSGFIRHDYTRRLIVDSERFATAYMVAPGSLKARVARFIVERMYWLCPGYIWVLEKPAAMDPP